MLLRTSGGAPRPVQQNAQQAYVKIEARGAQKEILNREIIREGNY